MFWGGWKYILNKSLKALNIKKNNYDCIKIKTFYSIRKYKCNQGVEEGTCYLYYYIEKHPKIKKSQAADKNI